MLDPISSTDCYLGYIFASWSLTVLVLLLMLALPIIKHFQVRRQLARQRLREQRIKTEKATHDTYTPKTP